MQELFATTRQMPPGQPRHEAFAPFSRSQERHQPLVPRNWRNLPPPQKLMAPTPHGSGVPPVVPSHARQGSSARRRTGKRSSREAGSTEFSNPPASGLIGSQAACAAATKGEAYGVPATPSGAWPRAGENSGENRLDLLPGTLFHPCQHIQRTQVLFQLRYPAHSGPGRRYR